MKALLLVAIPACLLSGCVISASKNQASTRDVERPDTGPSIPESKYATVELEAGGLTGPIYEAPPDRAFVIQEIRSTMAADLVAEVAGATVVLLPVELLVSSGSEGLLISAFSSGVKLPPGAKLRLRRPKAQPSEIGQPVRVFVSGSLIRV
ncbi:MAG: hypothetical protein JNJ88_16745 [Planctomycetes bacterium]|nr:hypothetical protein [Planctomycetota bacterium]